MEWGKRLEAPIGEKYAQVTGRVVARAPELVRVHPLLPCMLGTVDFDVIDPKRGPGILEVKTLGLHRADEWCDEPPVHYAVQLQHYMAVTGAQWGSFAALIGGQRFVWKDVERNLFEVVVELGQLFGFVRAVAGKDRCKARRQQARHDQ